MLFETESWAQEKNNPKQQIHHKSLQECKTACFGVSQLGVGSQKNFDSKFWLLEQMKGGLPYSAPCTLDSILFMEMGLAEMRNTTDHRTSERGFSGRNQQVVLFPLLPAPV